MLEACPNDDFVLWRDPKVVTSVVIARGDEVVLGRRDIDPGRGLWCLPGGFVNQHESAEDAARREAREEISAGIEITRLIGVYHIAKTSAPSMVGIAYEATLAAGVTPAPGPEMSEVGFFGAADLPELAFPSHREILAGYFRSRASAVGSEIPSGGAPARRSGQP
jgi:ADP-ribose pyrophosphatase YjhB (NUDIX family)